MLRSPFITSCLVAATLLSGGAADAQDFPTRPITILVGVAPGGVTDLATRAYANCGGRRTPAGRSSSKTGRLPAARWRPQPFRTPTPDGYTLLTVVGAQFASIPAMQNNPAIRPHSRLPAHHADIPAGAAGRRANRLSSYDIRGIARTRKEEGWWPVLRHARRRLTPAHLLGAKIALATGTPMQYVHYRGGPPMITDLVTGRIDFGLLSYIAAKPHIDDKKLKGLVIDADIRIDQIPNVPTLIEAGLAKERVANWFGLAAPAGTPASIVRQLNAEFIRAASDPDVIKQLDAAGAQVATSTPEEMGGWWRRK